MTNDDYHIKAPGKRVAVRCAEEIDLHLSTGVLSLRYVPGEWVNLVVSEADEALLKSDARITVKPRLRYRWVP